MNIGVLVTRPIHQSSHFNELLNQAGARVISCPSIGIEPVAGTKALMSKLQQLSHYHILIFISANAVNYALKLLAPEQIKPSTIAAIGQSTQDALRAHGVQTSLQPESGFTSEHLLELEALQQSAINGKKILIFRGEGGRELLAQSLTNRGAQVDYAEVYRRTIPGTDIRPILDKWIKGEVDLVTVTSNQGLENLYHMLGTQGLDYLNRTPLIVPGKRCDSFARSKGHTETIIIASSALDKDMFQAVLEWHSLNNR